MTVTFTFDDLEVVEDEQPAPAAAAPAAHCLCGRFAKYLGSRSYYNGSFACYSYTVRCSRCGDVTVECV